MSNFINELVDIVIRKTSKTDNNFKYNYFDYYSDNMGLLEKINTKLLWMLSIEV
jgi:hypothetical protein